MPNWVNLQNSLQGIGQALSERQKKKQEWDDAIRAMMIEAQIKKQFSPPQEWKPTSMQEALEFERAKRPATDIRELKFSLEQEEKRKQQERESEFVKQSALESLDTISEVKKGIGYFGDWGEIPTPKIGPFGQQRRIWEANVNKLLSERIVNLMTQMKQASRTGATGFGQLNREELRVLENASTALKKYLPPDKALEYISKMEGILNKIVRGEEQIQPQESAQQGRQLDENTARQILQRVGGDKNKARALAKQMGYQF